MGPFMVMLFVLAGAAPDLPSMAPLGAVGLA